jgi:hypothetical protein
VNRSDALRWLADEFVKAHPFLARPGQANGLCLWSSLSFASYADREGFPVDLICWQRSNDDFSDHWAVISGDSVIDHTRAQVDGQTALYWQVDQYPAHYIKPRVYPALLFLPVFERLEAGITNFPPAFLAHVISTRNRHDRRGIHAGINMATLGAVLLFAGWRIFEAF